MARSKAGGGDERHQRRKRTSLEEISVIQNRVRRDRGVTSSAFEAGARPWGVTCPFRWTKVGVPEVRRLRNANWGSKSEVICDLNPGES